MKTKLPFTACLIGALLAGCAGLNTGFTTGDGIFIVGDTAYIDGHPIPKTQYEAAEAKGTLPQLRAQLAQAATAPAVKKVANAATPIQASLPESVVAGGIRTAICDSFDVYDAYPGDNVLFSCTAGLGNLTRTQLLTEGWKIDLMEKIPAGAGRTSSRGLPLFAYKLVLSR